MSRFYTLFITLLLAATAGYGQEPPVEVTDLTPRVDTLWTLTLLQTRWVDFQGCAMGGTPPGFIVATQRAEEPQHKFLVEYDIATGKELRSIRSGHYGGVQDMSFARDANVFASCEGTVIKVWRWPEMELIRTIYCSPGQGAGSPSSALLTNDGRRVFDAASGVMFDVASGDTVWFVGRPLCDRAKPKLSTDGHFLLVHDCGVNAMFHDRGILFDAETGRELGSFGGGSGDDYIAAMAVSAEGRYVAITRMYGHTPPANGSILVYDRDTKTIVMSKALGMSEGGRDVTFTPGNTGIIHGLAQFSLYKSIDYYPAWATEPTVRYIWTGFKFSKDWTLNYDTDGYFIGISRFNLETVGVQEELPPSPVLYPNPGDGTITAVVAAPDGPVVFTISDVSGREASAGSAVVNGGRCHLHATPPLPSGTYMLRLSRAGKLLFSSPLVVR